MDAHVPYTLFDRLPISKSRASAVKWFKEWVPQDLVSTGGKSLVLKWVNEATLRAMREKSGEPHGADPEPEPTTEVLFLCSYEGCGKTFIDAGALRKHSHIHGERQYICHYENCGKKFLDSSKLKRHFLIHTGERDFVCPHEGCGKVRKNTFSDEFVNPPKKKAFSLDFNLRSHMKTHSQENYHVCPYPECEKRYAHEYKLKNHVATHHEKGILEAPKYTLPPGKPVKPPKSATGVSGSASADRPYGCPYQGCEKAYIHEYKLNLHLRREHPGHFPDENSKNTQYNAENEVEEGSDQDGYFTKCSNGNPQKQNRAKPSLKLPPSKVPLRKSSAANMNLLRKPWPRKEDIGGEEDSEETDQEERENVGDGWRYGENNEDDDEETECED